LRSGSPSQDSFNNEVLEAFTKGLSEAHHTYEIGDLYRMNFESEMDLEQYHREVGLDPLAPVPDDVRIEQEKIYRADVLAFIYPVWWSDCPAKLKGWFDRLLEVGVKEARMEILGKMMPKDDTYPQENLEKVYDIARSL
jgi:NAD(P)H dehydrogenase (quinone)